MDAMKDITEHPAYKPFRNARLVRKRVQILDLTDKMKSHIATHNLTERVVRPGRDYAHYKECFESRCTDCSKHDTIDGRCVCEYVCYYRAKILQLLDDIEAMSGRGLLNRIRDTFKIS